MRLRLIRISKIAMICSILTLFKCPFALAVDYEYDAKNRLVRAAYGNGVAVAYVYDNAGNRRRMLCSADTDGDGLPDIFENEDCPRPDDPDSDGDGIEDGVEDANQNGIVDAGETDPCAPDTDGDGLTDGQEDMNLNGTVDAGERDPRVKDNVFGADSTVIASRFAAIGESETMDYAGTGSFSGYRRYIRSCGHETIDGIECLKITVKGYGNHPDPEQDPEWFAYWLARDTSDVIWVLQVYDALADCTTTYGQANALVWMPADPVEGQRYGRDGSNYYEVLGTNAALPRLGTGAGPFYGCLKVRRSDGGDEDVLYICPRTGIVKEEWNNDGYSNGWELEASASPIVPWIFLLLDD